MRNLLLRASIRGALFAILLLGACANSAQDSSSARVKYVIDGDTFILQNGDKVRLTGINTPELGYGKFADEPLANVAKEFLKRKVQGKVMRLEQGQEKQDRHGRLLAHIYTKDGQNIQQLILERGLAFAVAVGQDLDFLPSYLAAEKRAFEAQRGIWKEDYFAPVSAQEIVNDKPRGYHSVEGVVQRVSRSKRNQTLHLDADFRVLIPRENWEKYFKGKASQFVGKKVLARGWLFQSGSVIGVKVYHPSMVSVIKP